MLFLSTCSDPPHKDSQTPRTVAQGAFDLLIAGGTVIDGTGVPGRKADILFRDGRIAFVGSVDPDTLEVRDRFDATGLVVTPGFIDAHAHGDPVGDPGFANFLAMGVTTIVLGQDGDSPEAGTLTAYLDEVDAAGPSVNVAFLVGHNTIRLESGVGHGDPGSEGLVRMSDLVAKGLSAGAFGLSTGLEYDPGTKAGPAELSAIAGPVAAVGGVVTSHLRSEDADQVEESLRELIAQGRRSGARVHVSHIKIVLGKDSAQGEVLLTAMERARQEGVEVTADLYPYTASYTGTAILFPDWARPPNDYAGVVRDRRGDLAAHLRRRVESRNGPEAMLFGSGDRAGRTLAEVAGDLGLPYEDVLVDIGPDGAAAAYFVMDEDVVRTLLLSPYVVVSSDGSPTMLHPRGFGSFSRVIRRYVEEEGVLGLEEAVRKMSGATASLYRLDDPAVVDPPRGLLREGWAADLLAFDPADIRDPADYGDPHRLSEGMMAVWIGGRLALRDGTPAPGAGHGAALRARWRTPGSRP